MKRALLIALIFSVILTGCGAVRPETATPVAATAQPGTLVVDLGRDLGPISPYVYGSNLSLYAMVPSNKVQEANNAYITALRMPGGGWGETNDLQTYQMDLLISVCKQMGAIPTMSVRLVGGTPEAAAELVRYANIEKGYNITFWSIGNEPDYEKVDGKNLDTRAYNTQWRAIAMAMKAVDPKIKLMGPELSQWGTDISNTPKTPPIQTPSSQPRQDWMTDFLKANGDLVDIVTVHRYPMYAPSSPTPITIENLRQNTLQWEPMAIYLRSMIKQITGRDLPIAFTEVNSDPSNVVGGEASPDSFYNSIWYADVVGHLIQQNVFMVNQWAIANAGGLGLLETNSIRPTYYVFQMYSHFGNEQVYASSGTEFVTVYAAKRTDGTLTVIVINLTDAEQHMALQVKGMNSKQIQVWRLDASHNATELGKQALPADGILDLPAQSMTLYEIQK